MSAQTRAIEQIGAVLAEEVQAVRARLQSLPESKDVGHALDSLQGVAQHGAAAVKAMVDAQVEAERQVEAVVGAADADVTPDQAADAEPVVVPAGPVEVVEPEPALVKKAAKRSRAAAKKARA